MNPSQWSLGIKFSNITSRALDRLTWLTPFALSAYEKTAPKTEKNKHPRQAPSLYGILEATSQRTAWIMLGNYATSDDFLKMIDPNARTAWQSAIKQASRIPLLRHDMTKVPSDLPGQWLGFQVFATSIPDAIIPYLELASIIHIGKYTHYGCGTFVLVWKIRWYCVILWLCQQYTIWFLKVSSVGLSEKQEALWGKAWSSKVNLRYCHCNGKISDQRNKKASWVFESRISKGSRPEQ